MGKRFNMDKVSLIEYGDSWEKIEERTIEFFAMMICCADYPIRLDNYSDIDDIRKANDFEDTMFGYRILAREKLKFIEKEIDNDISEYRTNEIVKFDYSDICKKSADEMYTDTPLRNDEIVDLLNSLSDENEQLKKLISKIDFALIRKYDNSLKNILDEIYDGEYNKWIEKQVKRSRDLE